MADALSPTDGAEAASLRVVTRRLDGDLDLLAVAGADGVLWERGRAGVAGRGVALRVPTASAAAVLAAADVDDEVGLPGCGAVAFGALPFDPAAPSELIVPHEVWGRSDDGTRWHTTIDPAPAVPPAYSAEAVAARFSIVPSSPPEWWCALVERTTKAIADGPLEKVVLAREVMVEADAPIDRVAVLRRLRRAYPTCHLFHVDGFLGASPELLVSAAGDVVRSHPMAGTAPAVATRRATPGWRLRCSRPRRTATSTRSRSTWCTTRCCHGAPSSTTRPNRRSSRSPTCSTWRRWWRGASRSRRRRCSSWCWRCTRPRRSAASHADLALAYILEHEGFDRCRYAGAAGWVDGRGNGAWSVSVRTAQVDGSVARLVAGCGIVVDSDPSAELEESRTKLQAMLGAIIRP